jgi:DNA-directed RNA polymerase subunit K/omega
MSDTEYDLSEQEDENEKTSDELNIVSESESEWEEDNEEGDVIDVGYKSELTKFSKEIIIIKEEDKKFSNILNRFEMAEIISIRATQIKDYNNCMVDITGLDDPIKMAKRELMMRMTPLILRRYVGKKIVKGVSHEYYEFWDPKEMVFSVNYNDNY